MTLNNNILFQVKTSRPRRARWTRFIKTTLWISVFIAAAYMTVPSFFNLVMDKLERQRQAEHEYYCKHYGAEMNKHAGRVVCP